MKVFYMNGAGNDFMVIDARNKTLDLEELALKLCPITGADGFMALDISHKADFKLHFYNSDGTRGEMCGNGARCICKFAYDLGVCGETMTVETDAGIVPGWRLSGVEDYQAYQWMVNLKAEDVAYVELGDPGVPHGVKEIPGLTWEQGPQLWEQAKALRHDPAFPKGANINLYSHIDEKTVRVLTFERGVEDYTLACGTGCGSVASVLWAKGKLPGNKLTACNRGGDLTVTVEGQNGKIQKLLLEGPAETVKVYDYEL